MGATARRSTWGRSSRCYRPRRRFGRFDVEGASMKAEDLGATLNQLLDGWENEVVDRFLGRRGLPHRSAEGLAPQRGSLMPAQGSALGSCGPGDMSPERATQPRPRRANHGLGHPFKACRGRRWARAGRCPWLAWTAPMAVSNPTRRILDSKPLARVRPASLVATAPLELPKAGDPRRMKKNEKEWLAADTATHCGVTPTSPQPVVSGHSLLPGSR